MPDPEGGYSKTALFWMWLAYGEAVVACFAVAVSGVWLLPAGDLWGIVLGVSLMAVGSIGIYFASRVWWSLSRDLCGFPPAIVSADTKNDDSPPMLLGNLTPHSRQYDEAAERCRVALEQEFEARQVSPKGVSRLNALLRQVVEPVVAGQIELIEAFEIRSGQTIIHYGIVSYNESVRTGRRVSQSTGVGHLAVVPLDREICRVRIKPESLLDKFGELVAAEEIDLPDHPQFSRRYLLHADSKDAVLLHVPGEVWIALGAASDLVVAGKGSTWVIGCEGGILPERAIALMRVALEVADAFASAPR
jgi:hypothetical protein